MKIHIRTVNSAFYDGATGRAHEPGPELARILRGLADKVENDGQPKAREVWMVRDINGNKCGTVRR